MNHCKKIITAICTVSLLINIAPTLAQEIEYSNDAVMELEPESIITPDSVIEETRNWLKSSPRLKAGAPLARLVVAHQLKTDHIECDVNDTGTMRA